MPRQHERLTYPDDFEKQGNPSFARIGISTADSHGTLVSGQYLFYRMMILDTGQTNIQPLKSGGQTPMVDAQAMQNRRVHVVNVDGILRDVIAEVVGLSVNDSRLDSATGHPD